ncbi:MAG: hypothetical protein L0Z62_37605 [Gemmataceae bacterium]|nr:hypothetical protein [Gemmataceae bacterium]
MTTKTKTPSRGAAPRLEEELPAGPWQTPPWTTSERLQRIEVMGQRIHGYIQFIGTVGNLNGTSAEAKEKAVAAFYDRIVVLERQLGRIQEDLQLG